MRVMGADEDKDTALWARLESLAFVDPNAKFKGKPDAWWDDPHWRCINDHVSTWYLKSEENGALCLAAGCRQRVYLTFPTDRDGSLQGIEDASDG